MSFCLCNGFLSFTVIMLSLRIFAAQILRSLGQKNVLCLGQKPSMSWDLFFEAVDPFGGTFLYSVND